MPVPLMIAVMGPTGSGKTELAESIADRLGAQLFNGDAFQVYRGMDIGTAKSERRAEYRLLDLKDPSEPFGVGEYVLNASSDLAEIYAQGRHAVVVGGTGLYIRALFEEYDAMNSSPPTQLRQALSETPLDVLVARLRELSPDAAEKTDLRNPVRVIRAVERILAPSPSISWRLPPFRKLKLAIVPEPSDSDVRIARRVEAMVQNGWVQEVRELRGKGYGADDPGFRAIGYGSLCQYLDGKVELDEAKATAIVETRQYAKRQRSWLRSEPNLIALKLDDAYEDSWRHINWNLGLGAEI